MRHFGMVLLFVVTTPSWSQYYTLPYELPPTKAGQVTEWTVDQLVFVFTQAKDRDDSMYVVLHQVAGQLHELNARVQIPGSTYLMAGRQLDFGGERIDAFVPAQKLISVSLGHTLGFHKNILEVQLTSSHKQQLEGSEIHLESRYGFKDWSKNGFIGAFGTKVSQFFLTFDVERLELETHKNNIAIHLSGFPRPKRLTIPGIQPIRPKITTGN